MVDLTPDQCVRSSLEAKEALLRLAFRRQSDPAAAVLAADFRNRIDFVVADLATAVEAPDSSIQFPLGFPSDLLMQKRQCSRFLPPTTATRLRNSLVSSWLFNYRQAVSKLFTRGPVTEEKEEDALMIA